MNFWTSQSIIFLILGTAHLVVSILCLQAGEIDIFQSQWLGGIFELVLAIGFLIKGELSL
jgi:hypothetical protein